jgi:hypothetical protein
MKAHGIFLTWSRSAGRFIALIAAVLAPTLLQGAVANAQTRSARDTATAYGARLSAKGEPANLNPNRINNRVNTRLDTRLSLRVERYRPQNTIDPAAAFAVRPIEDAQIGAAMTRSASGPAPQVSDMLPMNSPPRRGADSAGQR